MVLKIVPG